MLTHCYASLLYAMCTLTLLAVATPATTTLTVTAPAPTVTTASQCESGDVECCDTLVEPTSTEGQLFLGLVGVALAASKDPGLIGLECSPASIIGVSSDNCNTDLACCTDNGFVLDVIVDTPRIVDGVPVKMAARRYIPQGAPDSISGLTLLFAHGIGSHKEVWLPIIESFYQQSAAPGVRPPDIREIWLLDCQNHGDSALLNDPIMPWSDFLRNGLKRSLISARNISRHIALFVLVIPEELSRSPEDVLAWRETVNFTSKAASKRRDEWDSSQDAFRYLTKRFPWNTWDERIVRVFAVGHTFARLLEHGVRPIRKGDSSVTLKCPRHLEAQSYNVHEEYVFRAMDEIERLCDRVAIHVLFGEYADFVPEYGKTCVTNMRSGRKVASLTFIPEAGHFVTQQKPDAIATRLLQIMVLHQSLRGSSALQDRTFSCTDLQRSRL
ncbi:hypothetical protein NM688_g4398 [Phlebia brevispora]|uniref:Uncharacterized protein n=1 Tax=Phlebia brevispora TaxID=194682 RepID=A0ACC1T382_9APHY|nr:hypothetical protein NM688_g4398 [Phlebia brevispora]